MWIKEEFRDVRMEMLFFFKLKLAKKDRFLN